MSPALRHGIRAYTTLQATALHKSVPPDRWCITRADLKYLGEEVWKAILSGEIQQPDDGSDDFQVLDTTYGPSIYTVNKQHIMPVTEKYGKVSWALLLHPDGLDCHLFISHAWQEGVFEFLSKVLHSWPADARHAWCCMLANPQNLDIGSLLQSPISSPFALALKASTYVLVVPNHCCSIYTRQGRFRNEHAGYCVPESVGMCMSIKYAVYVQFCTLSVSEPAHLYLCTYTCTYTSTWYSLVEVKVHSFPVYVFPVYVCVGVLCI